MAKTRKRTVRRQPPARRKRATSTALVRRPKVEVLPANGEALEQRIVTSEGMDLGALGLVELKLTPKEEAVLGEHVDPARILWRARVKDGPPEIPYLPWSEYTRWFNRAFGRTGWTLVPIGKASMTPGAKDGQQTITCPYVLYIHGKPVAFAQGEQEYFPANKQQTYGDALESTVGNAIRRVAKRIGVGLEMWDRDFIARLPRPGNYAPPPQEAAPRTYQAPRDDAPPAGHHRASGEKITDRQRKRLWVIIKNSGRDEEQVRRWLEKRFGWTSTKDITRDKYEFVCSAVESPAELPEASRG